MMLVAGEATMPLHPLTRHELLPKSREFYRRAQLVLKEARIPFLIGGAFALEFYTGVWRYTKDLDIFVRPRDIQEILKAASAAGFRTELTFSHWLGKIFDGDDFVDVIFSSGNGVARVDDSWFENAVHADILGMATDVCSVEDMIWSKAFVMERERFDGADIAHLIHARGKNLNWSRLLERFGQYWEMLFAHLVLFGFIYPGKRALVPDWLIQELVQRLQTTRKNSSSDPTPPFQGTLLSREQYLYDLAAWGYSDPRLLPAGPMTAEEIAVWTQAIEEKAG
jgi:Nucleotidyl transferase of unknown function (DUF2204)